MGSELFTSVQERFQKSACASTPQEKAELAPTFGEVLEAKYPGDQEKQMEIIRSVLKSVYGQKDTVGVGVADIQATRIVSRSDRSPVIRNKDSKFYNLLEMQGRTRKVTDPQFKINERDVVNNIAYPFNMDTPTLPAMIQSVYLGRTNTITAIGQQVGVSIFASEVSSQQGTVDVKADQLDDAHKRIRKGASLLLLANQEIVVEEDSVVPQMGGFITRSTTPGNTFNISGNQTAATLQEGYAQIRSRLGSENIQLLLWTDQAQVSVIDNLQISRYPGQNSLAYWAEQEMGKNMAGFQIPVDTVYKLRPGMFLPVVSDDQLPANTNIMFVFEPNLYPRLARFNMFGQEGPYDLIRPEKTLFEVVVSFDLVSLDDPIQPSRVVYTGVT